LPRARLGFLPTPPGSTGGWRSGTVTCQQGCRPVTGGQGSDCPGPLGTVSRQTDHRDTSLQVSRWNAPDLMDLRTRDVRCPRRGRVAGRRGKVRNQSHAGVLAHGGDAGNCCSFVVKALGMAITVPSGAFGWNRALRRGDMSTPSKRLRAWKSSVNVIKPCQSL